jgi:Lon protease-like protein
MHSLIWQCGLSLNLLVCAEQIRQLGYHSDGSVNVVTKGRQRFRICRAWTEPDGAVVPLLSIHCSQIVML